MDDPGAPRSRPAWWRRAFDAVFGPVQVDPNNVWSFRGQIAGFAILAVIPASFILGASDPEERLDPIAIVVIAVIGFAVIRYARKHGGR
jgi:hypothetical protein